MKEKCYLCGERFNSVESVYMHLENRHSDEIPKNFSASQFYYMLKTGKDSNKCIICKKPTPWNEATHKYNRFCDNPKCKEIYREEFKKRMIGVHGKIHLLNDPNQQVKMLQNRSISGKYKWSNGIEVPYTGTYELDFLQFIDNILEYDSKDIMSPSPHIYYYIYEGKQNFYIPDFFIPSLNLEVEIKDGGENVNKHPKIQAVDKVKEKLKDEVLMSQKNFNYIKITNKEYAPLLDFLLQLKNEYIEMKDKDDENLKPIFIIGEGFIDIEMFDILEESDVYVFKKNYPSIIPYAKKKIDKDTRIELGFKKTGNSGEFFKDYSPSSLAKCISYNTDNKGNVNLVRVKDDPEEYELHACSNIEEGDELTVNWGSYTHYFGDHYDYFKESTEIVEEVKYTKDERDKLPDSAFGIPSLRKFIMTDKGNTRDALIHFKHCPEGYEKELANNMYDKCKEFGIKITGTGEWFKYVSKNRKDEWEKKSNKTITESMGDMDNTDIEIDKLDFKSPEELHTFMKQHIKYSEFTHLRSVKDVYNNRSGDCHSQVMFASYFFQKMGIKYGKLFFIECNDNDCGQTHTLLYYYKNNKIYWFENSWGGHQQIYGPFNNLDDLKSKIIEFKKSESNFKKYPNIEFKNIKNNLVERTYIHGDGIKVGSDLKDYVGSIVKEGIIFSEKDINVNLDEWKREKGKNILFITGHSGSGKSTTSWDLADKYGARTMNLDLFQYKDEILACNKEDLDDWFLVAVWTYFNKIEPNVKNANFNDDKEWPIDKFQKEFIKFFEYCKAIGYKDPSNLYIIEGVQIFNHFTGYSFANRSVIIKGESILKSYFRSEKRENHDLIDSIKRVILGKGRVQYYLNSEKFLNAFKKEIIIGESTITNLEMRDVDNPKIENLPYLNRMILNAKNVYIDSDYHLYKYENNQIVKNKDFDKIVYGQSSIVNDNDVFIYLGDIVDRDVNDIELIHDAISKLRGIKVLVLGNNDTLDESFYKDFGFQYIIEGFKYKNLIFTHKPVNHEDGTINAHGHFHSGQPYQHVMQNNHFLVYGQKNNFKPINIKDIKIPTVESYQRPLNLDQIKHKYNKNIHDDLSKDPIHKFRADSGIELIHKEPTKEELIRIWKNWKLMTNEQKKISDAKSIELFGVTNEVHYNKLIKEY